MHLKWICNTLWFLFKIDLLVLLFPFYSSVGWRLGLQEVTGVLFITFLLGTFYRSASLYHPQRRAILHLKTQKRKIKNKDKEKNKLQDDTPPFFDFSTLKSRTVQIILMSVSLTHFGIYTPLFLIVSMHHPIYTFFTFSCIEMCSVCLRFSHAAAADWKVSCLRLAYKLQERFIVL